MYAEEHGVSSPIARNGVKFVLLGGRELHVANRPSWFSDYEMLTVKVS